MLRGAFAPGPASRTARRSGRFHRTAAILVLLTLLAAPLPTQASLVSWAPLAQAGSPLHAVAAHGATAYAVGVNGHVLRADGDAWVNEPVPTTKTLHDVAIRHARHAAAVGADGIVLEMRREFTPSPQTPEGVESAAGTLSGTRAQWSIPLDTLDSKGGTALGVRAAALRGTSASSHPTDSSDDASETAAAVLLASIPTGTPPMDGHPHPVWANARTYTETGSVPFTLHLLRDGANLYAMVSSTSIPAPDHLMFQVAARHGPDLRPGDLRLVRLGSDLAAEHTMTVPAQPAWRVALQPGALAGVGDLNAVSFTGGGSLVAAGANGKVIAREGGIWTPYTATGGPTFRAADTYAGHVYLAGGNAQGTSGGTIHRFTGSAVQIVSAPLTGAGLWDIDMAACRAVGSGGTVLRCLDDTPTQWGLVTLQDGPLLQGVARDGATGRVWAAGTLDGVGTVYFLNNGGNWIRYALPTDTAGVSALAVGLGGPLLATVVGELLVLRAHPPEFIDLPDLVVATSGETLTQYIRVWDRDGDPLDLTIEVPPQVETPIDIWKIDKDTFVIEWTPDYKIRGNIPFQLKLLDGKHVVEGNFTVVIDPVNGPPAWQPHPDVVIPHSTLWTTNVLAIDPDGGPLILSAPTLPAGATFVDLGGGAGTLDWVPGPGDLGPHAVVLDADDGALSDTLSFTVTVVDRTPPVIDLVTPKNPRLCVKGPFSSGTVTFYASAHDPDGDPVSYSWWFSDTLATKIGPTVSHTFTSVGIVPVVLSVTDVVGLVATRTLNVQVTDCVHGAVEMLSECFDMIHPARGIVRMWDHTGAPASGTYEMQVWWRSMTGPYKTTLLQGEIVDGEAAFVVPFDLGTVPLNEPVRHSVHATVRQPSHLGGTVSLSTSTHYFVQPECDTVPWRI